MDMKTIVVVIVAIGALCAAIHFGGDRVHDALRHLHGGGSGVHSSR
jgi:hypothetical protein